MDMSCEEGKFDAKQRAKGLNSDERVNKIWKLLGIEELQIQVLPWVEQLQSESEYGDIICKLKRGEQVSPYWIENDKLWMTNAEGRVQAVVPQSCRRKLFQEAHSVVYLRDT
ncbi:unnamed protein product [Gongylonema pulchrum]|uniref:Transposase n=1 Tax=Gongylonema pulchrum TaxID=637853 RepID=A0A183EYS2_9BILA|nr:unnamed protein product [Gongylonema pulchrum]